MNFARHQVRFVPEEAVEQAVREEVQKWILS